MPRTLTADFVSSLQRAVARGKNADRLLSNVTTVTLPGLLEFLCLREAAPAGTFEVPPAVSASVAGRALRRVLPDLRLAGAITPRGSQDVSGPGVEFFPIPPGFDPDVRSWELFAVRFSNGAMRVGLPKQTAGMLGAALQEMAENVVRHADTRTPAVAGYEVTNGHALFCVADLGVGVLQSLRGNPEHRSVASHHEAIRRALMPGVSGRLDGGGNGFHTVFQAIAERSGKLRFRSGEAIHKLEGEGLAYDTGATIEMGLTGSNGYRIPGFQVAIGCRVSRTGGRS